MKSFKNIYLLLLLLTIISTGCSSNQTPQYDLSGIDYRIVKTEDYSMATAKRMGVHVLINNNPATKEHIRAITNKIVDDYENKVDAIAVSFYFEESQVGHGYTLAKAEWAPYGDWSKANLKKNQEIVYEFKGFVGQSFVGQERTNEPTPEEREINNTMRDLWYEMMETNDSVTDEEVAIILAPQYGKTVDEMLDIQMKVLEYDLGL